VLFQNRSAIGAILTETVHLRPLFNACQRKQSFRRPGNRRNDFFIRIFHSFSSFFRYRCGEFDLQDSKSSERDLPAIFAQRKLPYLQGFGPLRHIVALAPDIGPTIMITADLLHEKCDTQIGALVSQIPHPRWLHGARTNARLAAADDPVWNAFVRLKRQLRQRAKRWLVRNEFDGGADPWS
jgi:hypothetical protein